MRKPIWLVVAIMMLALPARATPAFPAAAVLLEAARTGEPVTAALGSLGERAIRVWPNAVVAPGARATLRDATGSLHEVPLPAVDTLAGRVLGDDASVVRLTIADGIVAGTIATGVGAVSIHDGEVADARADVSSIPVHDIASSPEKDHGSLALSYFGTANCRVPCGTLAAHVILDADDTFRALGPDTCFARQIETLNDVDGIYALAETDIDLVVTQLNCWTSNELLGDASTPAEEYLDNVRLAWDGQGQDRSTILHAVGFDMPGSTVGIAWLPGVCARAEPLNRVSPNRCAYGQAVYQAVPTGGYTASLFLRAKLAAHEIGHNFNAEHETAGCTGAGSIMCASLQTAGPNTFSPASASVIRQHAETTIGHIACVVGRDGVGTDC